MIADLKPYPAMKDSCVPWLGEVPEHWEMVPNRALLRLKKELVGSNSDDYLLLSLTKQGVVTRDMENPEGKFPAQFDSYQVIEPGDLIFCLFDIDETPRTVGLSSLHGMITGAYTRFVGADETTRRFVYLLYVALDNGKHLKPLYTGLRKVITKSTFLSAKMPLPPPPEQAAIVRFLDHADRRIRRYIRAKQKLITLLEEQKRVIIHQAVTRGLNRNIGLKPGGVTELGDVPANWEKRRLKSIAHIRYGLGQPPRELSDGLPLIRATNVDHGRIVEKNLVYVDALDVPKSRDAFLSKKEIIVVRSGAYTADSAIIPEDYEGAVAGYDMIVAVTGAQPEFIAFSLLSNYVRDDQLIISSTRSAQPHINAEELGTAVLLLPPLDEQAAIVRYLDKATADIDIATDRARRQIDLLKEYRSRLIADVVTGKLDVRGAADGLPEVDSLADDDALTTQAAETGVMELEDATESPEELAMENEVIV